MSQGANLLEKAMGHGDNAVIEQNMTNPDRDRAKYGDTSETMKALAWMGKNDVQISPCSLWPPPLLPPQPSLHATINRYLQSNVLSLKSSKIAM